MEEYKNVLIGTNAFSNEWRNSLNRINKKNIIISNFQNLNNIKEIILSKNINYIIPMSNTDYKLIKNINLELYNNIKLIYPEKETIELLKNKNFFTEFMLKNYIDYIPDIYYLNNNKLKDIEYPAIYKPIYSTNGLNMVIIYNHHELPRLRNYNNIQKFIEDEYEYSAYMFMYRWSNYKQKSNTIQIYKTYYKKNKFSK